MRHPAFLGLAVALGLLSPVATAVAETVPARLENGARFGAWRVACEAVAVGETLCSLSQHLVRSDGDAFLAGLVALWDADLESRHLIATVPVGVHFPSGLALHLAAGGERLEFAWQVCSTTLCEARLTLGSEDAGRISAAAEPLLAYRPAPGAEPLVFRIETEGLAEGLDTLKAALQAARGQTGSKGQD